MVFGDWSYMFDPYSYLWLDACFCTVKAQGGGGGGGVWILSSRVVGPHKQLLKELVNSMQEDRDFN